MRARGPVYIWDNRMDFNPGWRKLCRDPSKIDESSRPGILRVSVAIWRHLSMGKSDGFNPGWRESCRDPSRIEESSGPGISRLSVAS